MYSTHNLIENLAQERHAERYGDSRRRGDSGTRIRVEKGPLAATRNRAGWLLVGLGLRLVMRGGDTPARRASLIS